MDCWHVEHGDRSLTRLLSAKGWRTLVVGRDGTAYGPDEWAESHTFWRYDQQNLLVSDAQTDRYTNGDDLVRDRLTREAWFPYLRGPLPEQEVGAC
jgi:hypothetical protein